MNDQEVIDALINEAKQACSRHVPFRIERKSSREMIREIRKRLGLASEAARWKKPQRNAFDEELRIGLRVRASVLFSSECQAKAAELMHLIDEFEENKSVSTLISIARILGEIKLIPKIEDTFSEVDRIALIARINRRKIIPLDFIAQVVDGKGVSISKDVWNKRRQRANEILREHGLKISLKMKKLRKTSWVMEIEPIDEQLSGFVFEQSEQL